MSGDLIPESPSEGWLAQLNLPKILAGPAGEAISKLVGGAVSIPAAWMQRVVQGIQDKTDAKAAVSKAVTTAAANLAASDPEIVRRAAQTLLWKELQHQTNREAVASTAIQILNEEPDGEQHRVDEDWFNVFEQYASHASSDRLQDIWGRVLAQQIRTPKTFSLQTLRFISELDTEIAQTFEQICPSIVDANFIPYPAKEGVEFTKLLRLEEFGLISGSSGALAKFVSFPGPGRVIFKYRTHAVLITVEAPVERFSISSCLLTRVGGEIYKLTKRSDDVACARAFANQLPKASLEKIEYVSTIHPQSEASIELWKKPTEVPQ